MQFLLLLLRLLHTKKLELLWIRFFLYPDPPTVKTYSIPIRSRIHIGADTSGWSSSIGRTGTRYLTDTFTWAIQFLNYSDYVHLIHIIFWILTLLYVWQITTTNRNSSRNAWRNILTRQILKKIRSWIHTPRTTLIRLRSRHQGGSITALVFIQRHSANV